MTRKGTTEMYADTGSLIPHRIAEAHRQADLERSRRPDAFASPTAVATAAVPPIDTRAAGEPIAAATGHAPASMPAVTPSAAECGECRTADKAA